MNGLFILIVALLFLWIHTKRLNPKATFCQGISEIQRKMKRGALPRFATHGEGMMGLRKWMSIGLAYRLEQQNANLRINL